jgi:hypothetical protein
MANEGKKISAQQTVLFLKPTEGL